MRIAVRALGANALAARAVADPVPSELSRVAAVPQKPAAVSQKTAEDRRGLAVSLDSARTLDALPRRAVQPSLFGAELQPKIIPFDTLPRTSGLPGISAGSGAAAAPALAPMVPEIPVAKVESSRTAVRPTLKPTAKPAVKRPSTEEEAQATLDFVSLSKPAGRTLKTNAEAVIYCDATVAAPVHRATAAALDGSMILIAFGMMLGTFLVIAHPGPLNKSALLITGGLLMVTALLYGLTFAIAGTVTPGLRWTNLRLINFDGFAPDWRSRALRLTGCWIGTLSGGLGLLWALVDEENLTWHDHISKSFPTLKESESVVVRHKA